MQPTMVDKEKPKKLEDVKHMAFATDSVKEKKALLNYITRQNRLHLGVKMNQLQLQALLKKGWAKRYSFRRDNVMKIFKDALKVGLQLSESKRPKEANKKGNPNYYPYHRLFRHSIENYYVFID